MVKRLAITKAMIRKARRLPTKNRKAIIKALRKPVGFTKRDKVKLDRAIKSGRGITKREREDIFRSGRKRKYSLLFLPFYFLVIEVPKPFFFLKIEASNPLFLALVAFIFANVLFFEFFTAII